ncbi:MAG: S8 family peptidase [Acidobacteriota bacterium]
MRFASPILPRTNRLFVVGLALGLLVCPPAAARERLSQDLQALRLVAGVEGRVDVIVRLSREVRAEHAERLRGRGAEAVRELRGIRGLAATVPVGALDALAADPDVLRISVDEPIHGATNIAVEAMGAWMVREVNGTDGTGIRVAVVDSGVAPVAALGAGPDRPLGRIAAWVDLVEPHRPSPVDPYGHGTHVAGIIAGAVQEVRDASGGRAYYGGVAPGAEIVSVRVLDHRGEGRTSDAIAGLEWVMDHAEELGIRVVNLSFGHPVREPADDDPLVIACREAWRAGLVVVTSAGNLGTTGLGSVSSPGNAPELLTVGALVDWDTAGRSDDTVATYSSRGPSRFDGFVKPDLLAPGDAIVSLRSPHSLLDRSFGENRVGSDSRGAASPTLFRLSGTSMAAASASGGVALLLALAPEMDPDSVKLTLMRTAEKRQESLWARGAGALDLAAAADQLLEGAAAATSPTAVVRGAGVGLTGVGGFAWEEIYGAAALWDLDLAWELLQEEPQGGELLWQVPPAEDTAEPVRWKRVPGPSPSSVVWQVDGESVVWQGKNGVLGPESVVWQGRGDLLTAESVVWQGRGDLLTAESVVWQGRGDLLAAESVVWQGRGDLLTAESVVWQGRDDPLRILILGEEGLEP